MSNIYLDKEAADGQVRAIQEQIEALRTSAGSIDSAMTGLSDAWKGASADKAQETYDTDYKKMLTETIPTTVEEFKNYMDGCVSAINETDLQLSGQ